ncbi:MAG: hypothetical protein HYV60_03945, partial [Planctomycetia bacterium]|nr:hypothetical protein [Planctomycetia bacterium]
MIWKLGFAIGHMPLVIGHLPRVKQLNRILTVALVFGIASAGVPVAARETLLRWKFAAGEQWQVSVDQRTTTETTGAGKPTGIDITLQMA